MMNHQQRKARPPVRVLVADDCIEQCAALSTYLSVQPTLEVVGQVLRGPLVVETSRRTRPRVVVLETAMQSIDPSKVIRELTDPDCGIGARVLVLTAPDAPRPFSLSLDIRNSFAAGATGYLIKGSSQSGIVGSVHQTALGLAVADLRVVEHLLTSRSSDAESVSRAIETKLLLSTLTTREVEVLALLGAGWTNAEISREFDVAIATTKTHVSAILKKLGFRDRVQAAIAARDFGLSTAFPSRPLAAAKEE